MGGTEFAIMGLAANAIGAGVTSQTETRTARILGQQEEANARREGALERGSLLASQAARGGVAGTGSNAEILAESAAIAAHNARVARFNARTQIGASRSRMAGSLIQGGMQGMSAYYGIEQANIAQAQKNHQTQNQWRLGFLG